MANRTPGRGKSGNGNSDTKEPGLPELHRQMRIANRLAAAQLKATMGQQELVRLLAGTGASNAEIADVLGTTPATVSVTMQRLKKKTKGVDPVSASESTPFTDGAPPEET